MENHINKGLLIPFRDKVLAYRPINVIEEEWPKGAVLHLEQYRGPMGIAGVAGHWGKPYSLTEMNRLIAEKFPNPQIADVEMVGFDRVYRTPAELTPREAISQEIATAKRVIGEVLDLTGWARDEIAGLFVGSGSPPITQDDQRYFDYAGVLANESGLNPVDGEIISANRFAACDSGGCALADALSNPNLKHKKVIVIGIDGLTRQVQQIDPALQDSLSPQIFSNGVAAIGVVPDRNMTMLYRTGGIVRDIDGALAAIPPYNHLLSAVTDDNSIWQIQGNTAMITLPVPAEGKMIDMHPSATLKFFVHNTIPFIVDAYNQHQAAFPVIPIDLIVSHHANKGISVLLQKMVNKRLNTNIDIPWVVHEGNSSGATTMIAFNRLLYQLQHQSHVMIISFGAGAKFDIFNLLIGSR